MEEKSLKITQKIFYQNIEILELKRIIFTGSMSTIPTLLKILTYLPPSISHSCSRNSTCLSSYINSCLCTNTMFYPLYQFEPLIPS